MTMNFDRICSAMDNEEKKYNILENILQRVNKKYITVPDDQKKRNNQLFRVINNIISKMRGKSVLFDNLFQNIYYGGSYYDGLKVGKPSEYDLDCVLRLPKVAKPVVEISDKPGYVHLVLKNMDALRKQPNEVPKYPELDNLLDGDRLSAKKVKSWMESVMTSVWRDKIDDINLKRHKSGPAITINMEGVLNEEPFSIDVDVVPCFTFFQDQWPNGKYRKNTSKKKDTFFVVPKTPNLDDVYYWRLSFQEQEKELINNYQVMKPTIRLIKKIRDRYDHGKIASYFIKTIFLWELDKQDKSLWEKSLTFVFITMLSKYADYLTDKNIPYYWNRRYNLIEDISDVTTSCIANKIKHIIIEIDRDCLSQPYNILTYFLTKSECDIENFRQEMPLSKKFLKQLEDCKKSPSSSSDSAETGSLLSCKKLPINQNISVEAELSSSSTSSFEEITKSMVNKPSSSLEKSSEQNEINKLLQTVIEKIDNLDNCVKQFREEWNFRLTEEIQERNKLVKMVNMLCKRVDDLTENS